ncbi:MAG: DUF2779 domain-containing protein, partial [Clostridia bacterium]|nr:DUF2779 domain-containing protein [Clostridia bacterium]
TYQSAIPEFDGTAPFLQIPFQYSLHYMESKNGRLHHVEFLAEPGADPRRELAVRLVNDIPQNVCVLAYNMTFEKAVIKRLAEQFSDLSHHLMNIHDNIKDLMEPFRKQFYYDRRMHGSYSIKNVLPALFPDDPELNYVNLDQIHNGGEAMLAYYDMSAKTDAERDETRRNLLKYCSLDTLAMVKILQKLIETAGVL